MHEEAVQYAGNDVRQHKQAGLQDSYPRVQRAVAGRAEECGTDVPAEAPANRVSIAVFLGVESFFYASGRKCTVSILRYFDYVHFIHL